MEELAARTFSPSARPHPRTRPTEYHSQRRQKMLLEDHLCIAGRWESATDLSRTCNQNRCLDTASSDKIIGNAPLAAKIPPVMLEAERSGSELSVGLIAPHKPAMIAFAGSSFCLYDRTVHSDAENKPPQILRKRSARCSAACMAPLTRNCRQAPALLPSPPPTILLGARPAKRYEFTALEVAQKYALSVMTLHP